MNKTILLLTLFASTLFNLSAQEWLTDINEAKKLAAERSENIVRVFQGSDWCAPCMKLEQEIWSTEVFKKYAKGHYICLLYTSDAADDLLCVDLGGRRIIK